MCLIIAAWKVHPKYPLIIAANRDEYYSRPATAADYWHDAPHILGGRDKEKGGTWLAINACGHFAAVTNFRGSASQTGGRSRGELVTRYLQSGQQPDDFLRAIDHERPEYNPFNLLVCDGNQLAYSSESHHGHDLLPAGLHIIGNDRLNENTRKLRFARDRMEELLKGEFDETALFEILSNRQHNSDSSDSRERALSAIFIAPIEQSYGTRASTLFWMDTVGNAHFREQQFDQTGPIGEMQQFNLVRTD